MPGSSPGLRAERQERSQGALGGERDGKNRGAGGHEVIKNISAIKTLLPAVTRWLRLRAALGGTLVVCGCLVTAIYLLFPTPAPPGRTRLTVAEALGERTEGFARALAPREFVFPEDHGPHPSFQSEWWYFTGNLQTSSGRRFGFQLTFFRFALLPLPPSGRNSAWAAHQVYMAHLALTDVSARQFWSFERFGRDALGLAGARGNPLRVWLEDWVAEGAADRLEPLRLQAREGKLGIDLTLMQGKPVVLQGEKGLSRKSEEPGNASYYYSLTRMPARGTLQIEGELFEVEGLAWMDREWSTSALAPEQVGWDWFALQLSDGRELVYFQLRRQDGSAHYRAGTFVDARGNAIPLGRDDVTVEVLDHWQSPRDGTPYPARWGLRVNRESLDLEVVPQVSDQELNLTLRYWEGAVGVTGTCRGEPLTGSGYVELTGYGSTPGRR